MKKIILYYPILTDLFQGIPYSLLFLERNLRDLDIDVVIIDQKYDNSFENYVEENKNSIIAVGISVMLSYQIINARKAAQYIKSVSTIPIIFGGWFVTLDPIITLREDFVDFVIVGQGEITFRELIKKLLNKENDFSDILGLGYKSNSEFILNPPRPWTNTFNLPELNFDKIDLTNYLEKGNILQYIASRGCNCKCNFCLLGANKGYYHFTNNPENVIKDLKYFKYRVKNLSFIKFNDDNFFTNRKFVLALCNLMIKENLQLNWNASANIKQFLKTYNDEDIKLIKQAGCTLIYFGAESGDEQILQGINKNYKPDDVSKVLKKLKSHNIRVAYSFMIGFPKNPHNDFYITLKFIMKLYQIDKNLNINLSFYLPILENKYLNYAKSTGYSIPNNYKEFEYAVTNGFNQLWINDKLKKIIYYYGQFYIPVFKKEYPMNTDLRLVKIWNLFFIFFHFPVYLRFLLKMVNHNYDAKLALKIINFFKKKYKIDNNNLNNFMIGINRIEK